MSVARHEQRLVTAEELWEMPEKPGVLYELVEGELIEVPGSAAVHNLIAALVYELVHDVVQGQDLGLVFTDNMSFVLRRDPDMLRIPDVSFVSWDRVPDEGVPQEGYWHAVPDLAVEVVSPGDAAEDVYGKVREYLSLGVRMVLVLWPRHRSASVRTPGGLARELGPDDELDGGDALPGFRVKVSELFAVRTRR